MIKLNIHTLSFLRFPGNKIRASELLLTFLSGSLRRSSLQVAFLAESRNTFTQTFVPFPLIDSSLTNVNVYVGEDEKLHFVDSTGADSVIPFSNVEKIPFTITLKKSTASSLTVYFSKEYDELPAVALELLTVDGSSGIYNGGVYPTLQIFNPIQLTNTYVTFNGLTETHASASSRTYTGNVWVMGK